MCAAAFVPFPTCLLLTAVLASQDPQKVKAKPDDDETLECRVPKGAAIGLLKWSRTDLEPDDYVFFYRDDPSYLKYQHESFRGRVELKDPEMKNGDVSVILKNVNIDDTGTYECYVGYGGKPELINTVNLTVEPSSVKSGNSEDGGKENEEHKKRHVLLIVLSVVGFLLVTVIVVVFLIHKKHKGQNSNKLPAEQQQL